MSARRTSPQTIRHSYHRALAALPLRSTIAQLPDPLRLKTVGAAIVDDRTVVFGVHNNRPSLWMTAEHQPGSAEATVYPSPHLRRPRVVGYVTGLVLGKPDLWVCDPESWNWVLGGDVSARTESNTAITWLTQS
ncbi:hypothetical protein [Glycomyces buryatensis]|uniref:Uncharacterized protein n=1 Tax=Glycomyces buryatensis TaxID=2570927 RepID=A0A4S8QBM6_9ACTN|nr:hypothetical protein [Glycomyces buryatensis]THV40941.1 hypothetical protein FAB82_13915 [Glycomyces buryatensis]